MRIGRGRRRWPKVGSLLQKPRQEERAGAERQLKPSQRQRKNRRNSKQRPDPSQGVRKKRWFRSLQKGRVWYQHPFKTLRQSLNLKFNFQFLPNHQGISNANRYSPGFRARAFCLRGWVFASLLYGNPVGFLAAFVTFGLACARCALWDRLGVLEKMEGSLTRTGYKTERARGGSG